MVRVHTIEIAPPLINSSCAWASDFAQLRELYDCPHTGAVTTRTATLKGYSQSDVHTVVFATSSTSTLNSYGYSPHPLHSYLDWVHTLLTTPTSTGAAPAKPIILSITSSDVSELEEMVRAIQELRARLKASSTTLANGESVQDPSQLIAVELNTSCPNIKDAPPPAYNFPSLVPLLGVLASAFYADPTLTIGLKLPPYLYATCFHDAISTIASFSRLRDSGDSSSSINPFAFITCVNTIGSALLFSEQTEQKPSAGAGADFALPTPLGGLGGAAIHPIALGNVYSFSRVLAGHADSAVRKIMIIGVGGVTDQAALQRMFKAGASIIGCATLLGQLGVDCFSTLSVLA